MLLSILLLIHGAIVEAVDHSPFRDQALKACTYELRPLYYHVPGTNETLGMALDMMEWLAQFYKFSSHAVTEMKDRATFRINPNTSLPYYANLLIEEKVDIIITPLVMTSERHRVVHFLPPVSAQPVAAVIPRPVLLSSYGAILKPFSLEVWLLITVSWAALAFSLKLFVCFLVRCVIKKRSPSSLLSSEYMLQVILNQGGYCATSRTSIRILAGCWCLTASVLVYVYNSTLTSHLFAATPQPVIKSIRDLLNNSQQAKLVVKRGTGTDVLLSTAEVGLFKHVGDLLKPNAKSRCATDRECLSLVQDDHSVYVNAEGYVIEALIKDYADKKSCEYSVIREEALALPIAFASKKGGSYAEILNRGVMSLQALGLFDEWTRRHLLVLTQCPLSPLEKPAKSSDNLTRLSLNSLKSCFLVLFVGAGCSLLAFLAEIAASCFLNQKHLESSVTTVRSLNDNFPTKRRMETVENWYICDL